MMFSTRAKSLSPGFGVSSAVRKPLEHARRHVDLVFLDDASACSLVEGSGTVGPEAMMEGSSPGTSEIIRATTLAG